MFLLLVFTYRVLKYIYHPCFEGMHKIKTGIHDMLAMRLAEEQATNISYYYYFFLGCFKQKICETNSVVH